MAGRFINTSLILGLALLAGCAGKATIDTPRSNLTGDPYFTDGLRAVFWIGSDTVAMDDIEFEEWERP